MSTLRDGPWGIAMEETDRVRWDFVPFVRVGPLRFGMDHEQVVAAIGPAGSQRIGRCADFWQVAPQGDLWPETQVTAHYGDAGRVCGVAISARRGPQVTWEGVDLVGGVPSVVEERLRVHATSHGVVDFRYSPDGLALEEFGVVMRVERTGDVLLTRPVFVAREWAATAGDPSSGPLSTHEWRMG
ncbi:hypothetical protein [Embleya sp. NPDC059237]|uniref:hypothetical protein n=1 Tax=Embleya sp. NPDC059237 TaxID=3346784 RepID=UPI0036B29DB8